MLIGDKYKVESDSLNVTLYKAVNVKKTGGIRWQPIAYFSSFQNALEGLIDMEVMATGLSDLKTVVKKQNELFALVKQLKTIPDRTESCTGAEK